MLSRGRVLRVAIDRSASKEERDRHAAGLRYRVCVHVSRRDKGHASSQVTTSGIHSVPHGVTLLGIVSLCLVLGAFAARQDKFPLTRRFFVLVMSERQRVNREE